MIAALRRVPWRIHVAVVGTLIGHGLIVTLAGAGTTALLLAIDGWRARSGLPLVDASLYQHVCGASAVYVTVALLAEALRDRKTTGERP